MFGDLNRKIDELFDYEVRSSEYLPSGEFASSAQDPDVISAKATLRHVAPQPATRLILAYRR